MDVDIEVMRRKIIGGLELIWEYLKIELLNELQKQGHVASSELLNSIEGIVTAREQWITLDGYFAPHGRFVDTGRAAGVTKVPVAALEKWIIQKGFETDAKKIKGMAFAIRETIFKVGISTPASWAGTSTKDWMSKTLDSLSPRISDDIERIIGDTLDTIIINTIQATAEAYPEAA